MENKNQPAFPIQQNVSMDAIKSTATFFGLTKLEYAVIHGNYEPTKEEIETECRRDKSANPYNDSYKPKLRSQYEIIFDLKIKYYSQLLTQLNKETL